MSSSQFWNFQLFMLIRNDSVYWAHIFRVNWNWYALSNIFRNFISSASSGNNLVCYSDGNLTLKLSVWDAAHSRLLFVNISMNFSTFNISSLSTVCSNFQPIHANSKKNSLGFKEKYLCCCFVESKFPSSPNKHHWQNKLWTLFASTFSASR